MLSLSLSLSLSFQKKHICLTGYVGGQKSTSSGVCRGPPSGHASPLGYFDRIILKLLAFSL
jgi:hypothetical protein